MSVVMKAQATPEQIQAVCGYIEQLGFRPHPLPGAQRTAIGIPGTDAVIAAGADGILVEVHHQPGKALSDGPQSIYPAQFATMMQEIGEIAPIIGRWLPRGVRIATPVATSV
jgi:DAHP synthase ferredoxin-like domain/DAHP synthetase I family